MSKRINDPIPEIDLFASSLCIDVLDYIILLVNNGNAYNHTTSRDLRLINWLFYTRIVRLIHLYDDMYCSSDLKNMYCSSDLTSWPFLKKLCIYDTYITDPIFDALAHLTDLTIYNFEESIKSKRNSVADFSSLKCLDIMNWCGLENEHFKNLIGLTRLSLSYISKNEIVIDKLSLLVNLKRLELVDCSSVGDRELASLTQLEELNLDSDYGEITDVSICLLTNLTNLSLVHTPCVTGKSLAYMTNLTQLNLQSNNIETKDLYLLTKLRSLDLSYNECIESKALYLLTNLTHLNLACDHLIDDTAIIRLTNLTELDLCCKHDIHKESILSLPLLKTLSIDWIGHPLLELKDEPMRRFEIKEIETEWY